MAELLVVVVVVVFLLGYAADRARKLRVRARQMSGMNDRLDVAAAKVDKEQQQRRARVVASGELTSVMPAIKRPPLTIPGMAGHGDVPEEAEEPEEQAAPGASPAAGPVRPRRQGRLRRQGRPRRQVHRQRRAPLLRRIPRRRIPRRAQRMGPGPGTRSPIPPQLTRFLLVECLRRPHPGWRTTRWACPPG